MSVKTIRIGNMCCSRCITSVAQVLTKLGINYKAIDLGYAEVHDKNNSKEIELKNELKKAGFKFIKDKEEEISEKIKIAIHELFIGLKTSDLSNLDLRNHLENKIRMPYKKLAEIFTRKNKKTIEGYFIRRRIEEAKAMISDSDHSFSEIAAKLGYNSLSYLSKQFRASEGVSMSDYKLKPNNRRKFVDKL